MRLAPSPAHLPETPISQSQSTRDRDAEDDRTGGRIDVRVPSVLESFIEPLDTLLQVDEISNARAYFEDIVGDVTRAVHEHFHLQRPQRNQGLNGPGRAGLDLKNPQKLQQAYKWNRRKCVRAITQDTAQRCPVGVEETYEYFKSVWETSSSPEEWRHGETPTRPPVVESLSQAFVAECLRAVENSAPGQDMIAYRHWREIDPDYAVLTRIYNVCLKMANIPEVWKSSRTILIHKKGEWCETHEVLSPAQKGFSPYDGVLEHNFLLTQHLEAARRCKKNKFVAWLDISNAFGSVPRQVILDSLVACGVDQDFITLVCSMYHGSNTSVLTEEGPTPPIQLKNGVKQGCPLSGILFNLSIGKVLHTIQENREGRAVLAFADDLVLLADGAEELQEMIDTTAHELEALCLSLNARKCATLHLSGVSPTGTRPTQFKLKDIEIQALDDGTPYAYVGNPVGFFVQKHFKTVNEALSILEKLSASNLAQWQKSDALKTFFFPTLSFSMRTGKLGKDDWDEVDVAARREIKYILSLPPNASNHYIYGNRKLGGCGIPSAAEDSDFYLVDSAFKLLTSKDETVRLEALGQLTRTVAFRIKRDPTDGDLIGFLSGSMVDEYSDTTNQCSNHSTLARKASSRQNVSWSFVDGSLSVTIGADVLSPTKRRSVMRAFHDNFQLVAIQNLLAAPSQGKVMDCVAMSPASTHFFTDGKYTRFADWRFIHKARLNLVPLNAYRKGPQPSLRACRKCGEWDETFLHVLNHCKSYSAAWQLRHNAVLARIRAAVAFKGTILSENQVAGPNRLRPDLVANVDNKIYIIDVTIPFENRRGAFSQAR
ncbi:retrovirus-related Pol polyprotein from type-2 retrotransposable element R2DM [Trichonephila clavipes]|nr:retrovirus-related Pol polyprotein from type-2 retrotransposable element R2DM [Trichonephila clavipes]